MSFDVSLHLAETADLGAIDAFSRRSAADYDRLLAGHARALRRDRFSGGHVWCADARWSRDGGRVSALVAASRRAGLRVSASVDPRRGAADLAALDAGADGAVLSPVHAGFGEEVLRRASWRPLVRGLARRGKPVFVTTAYGTAQLYERDSLRVLAGLLRAAPGLSVTALHGGGHRFRELVLLAEAHPNLSVDLSFTVLYYQASGLETDWVWGMRKLGPSRFVFGSDEPFASRRRTLAAYERLGRRAGWSASARAVARGAGAGLFRSNA